MKGQEEQRADPERDQNVGGRDPVLADGNADGKKEVISKIIHSRIVF